MQTSKSQLAEIQHNQLVNEMQVLPVLAYRQLNMRKVVAEFEGGLQKVADQLGYVNGSFLSQMLSVNATRKVTEKSARSFEQKLNLEIMSLDMLATEPVAPAPVVLPTYRAAPAPVVAPVSINTDLMLALIQMACGEFATSGVTLVPTKLASVLEMALLDAVEHNNTPRSDYVKRLVNMLK